MSAPAPTIIDIMAFESFDFDYQETYMELNNNG
jgi:hypothetical protein